VDKLLGSTVSHLAHETFLADALSKMRLQMNTVSSCSSLLGFHSSYAVPTTPADFTRIASSFCLASASNLIAFLW
jgi:hypothetical protein